MAIFIIGYIVKEKRVNRVAGSPFIILISVVFRFIRSVYGYTDVIGLLFT